MKRGWLKSKRFNGDDDSSEMMKGFDKKIKERGS